MLAVAISLLGIPAAFGANNDPMTLNLKDADIRAFIESMAELTGRNFVIDPRVQGKVTVISALPTDPKTLYEVFVSILKVHGFTAVESGDVVKIVPDIVARTQGGETGGNGRFFGEEPVTRVIELHYVTAAELVPVLQPLLPPEAHIAAHNSSNAIVVSDTHANVARIAQIIQRIDRKIERDVEVIRLNQANAADLARVLNATRPQTSDPATGTLPITVTADERTNSLIIGGDRDTRVQLRTLISHLDTPINVQSGVEVIYLRYAVAKDLVETLREVGEQLVVQTEQGPVAIDPTAGPPGQTGEARKLKIFADEATNALILQGAPDRLQEMRAIIQALDIRRAQVHVEGIIAEVSGSKSAELGIQWRTDNPTDGTLGGIIFPGVEAGSLEALDPPTFTLGTGLSLGFLQDGTIRALLRALASDGATNVLSTPTLVTMDNEEAEITVGQNVPFVTGQFTNATTTPDNPFQTIERKDVGVLLKVKPQINEGDAVKLTIQQEVSSVDRSTSGADLITNKRAIKTNVLVEDGQIIVIGGLISDDVRQNTQKVPLLGDIPLIGNAFRNRRSDVVKTNLMVFLRPIIMRDAQSASSLTLGKYSHIRDRQNVPPYDRVQLLPREPAPKLPEFPPPPPPKESGSQAPAKDPRVEDTAARTPAAASPGGTPAAENAAAAASPPAVSATTPTPAPPRLPGIFSNKH